MSKKILSLLIFSLLLLTNCKINTPGGITVWGSKKLISVKLNHIDFNEIVVTDKFTVNITQGDNYNITVKLNENLKDYLRIEKLRTVLKIAMVPNKFYKKATLELDITLPSLVLLDIKGMSNVKMNNFISQYDMELDISEASSLEGKISANYFDIEIIGGSSINLSGSGNNLKLIGSGASKIEMANFIVPVANIALSGISYANLNVTNIINASLSNSAVVSYSGGAQKGNVSMLDESKMIKK